MEQSKIKEMGQHLLQLKDGKKVNNIEENRCLLIKMYVGGNPSNIKAAVKKVTVCFGENFSIHKSRLLFLSFF